MARDGSVMHKILEAAMSANADEISTKILDAAEAEFMEFGLRRTAVEDVARRAGIARVTVYRRFANKNALMQAVFIRECARYISQVEEALSSRDELEERIVQGFVRALILLRNNPMINSLLKTDPELTISFLTIEARPVISIAQGYLAEHIRRGKNPKAAKNAEVSAELVMRLGQSFLLTPQSSIKLDDPRSVEAFARSHIVPLVMGRE